MKRKESTAVILLMALIVASSFSPNCVAFNIDLLFRWEFAPGSELSLAWKNAIYNSNKDVGVKFVENLKNTLSSDQTNSLSLKLLYYIDYNTIFGRG